MLRIHRRTRGLVALTLAPATGLCDTQTYPVSRDDVFLGLIAERVPDVYHVLAYGYATHSFLTPLRGVARDVARRDRRLSTCAERTAPVAPALPISRRATEADARPG